MAYSSKGEQQFINCTLSGPVRVWVKDGKIVRILPLEYTREDAPPWKIEARGQTFTRPNKAGIAAWIQGSKQYIYSPDRLLTPIKRKDFDPNGNRNPQNRGVSGYEPISWDEALDIIAQEILRIRKSYGPSATAVTGSSHDSWGTINYRMSAMERFWNLLGCTYVDHNPESWEGFFWGAIHAWGFHWRLGQPPAYDLLTDTFENTDMIVFWSADPTTTSGDYAWNETDLWRFHMKKLGIKFVFIDPFNNYTAVIDGDKVLRPRPGTDTCLALAIAYVWLKEALYDREYVRTHMYGFDKWKAYVLGDDDGVPKTPQWAEEKSGVLARDIVALAREWGTVRTTVAPGGRAGMSNAGRASYGHEFVRMTILLAGMQGLGKPGVNVYSTTGGAPVDWDFYFPGYADGGISGGSSGARELGPRGFPDRGTACSVRQRICRSVLPEAIINEKASWRGVYGYYGQSAQQQFIQCDFPFEGYSPIKMLFRQGASYIGTMMQTNRWINMYRSPNLEFALNVCPYKTEGEARLADIVLPACSTFEHYDMGEWARISGYSRHLAPVNARVLCFQQKCIEPLGESRSRYNIYKAMAERLGIGQQYTEGRTEYEWCQRTFEITDLPKVMTWDEWEKKGYYIVPVPENYKPTPAFRWFYEDRPKDTKDWGPGLTDNPALDGKGLSTPTGKIECEAQSLVRFDPNDEDRPPVPHYIPSWEGHETTELFKKYPMQFISPHPRFSFHSQHDAKSLWTEEIPHQRRLKDGYRYQVLRLNPEDAEKRGLKEGDLAKVYNDRGSILAVVNVTPRMRPGVAHAYGSGGGWDPQGNPGDPKTLDKGGTSNQLTNARFISKNCPGMAPNSCLVEIEKWMGGN